MVETLRRAPRRDHDDLKKFIKCDSSFLGSGLINIDFGKRLPMIPFDTCTIDFSLT